MAFKPLLAVLPGHTKTRVLAEVHSYTCSLLMAFKGRPALADPAVIPHHKALGKLTSRQVIMMFSGNTGDMAPRANTIPEPALKGAFTQNKYLYMCFITWSRIKKKSPIEDN